MKAVDKVGNKLWLYEAMSRRLNVRYIHKILIVAFLGTHVPLLALIGYFIATAAPNPGWTINVLVVALVATLAGTGLTLLALAHLLRPVSLTSRALRDYTTRRLLPHLPVVHRDEVGTLMADAAHTLVKLDSTIHHLDNYDALTALPNRGTLLRVLGELGTAATPFALCVLTLHKLDQMQSAFGIEACNAVLRELAARLEDAAGPHAHLSRVDGGMFAFVIDNAPHGEDVSARLAQIHAALPRECHVDKIRVMPELSMGIAWHPSDAATPQQLLNHAMSATAHAGAAGPGAVPLGFYSGLSRDRMRHRFMIEQDLRHALEHGELVLHFQPVIDLAAGRVTGAEALLRWNHAQRGMIAPNDFIPIAEQSGLISPLGIWVLQAACQQLRRWNGTALADLSLAINLSPRQFLGDDVVARIEQALGENGIAPGRLEIELTETAAMMDAVRARHTLEALREMGVRTAIDDFGTGYSSMRYLQTLPFDKIKIDRTFVSGIEGSRTSAAICKSMIELARGLDIAVLAEGTERREEVDFLNAMGCDMFQGFYFARPVAAEAFAPLLGDTALTASMRDFVSRAPAPAPAAAYRRPSA